MEWDTWRISVLWKNEKEVDSMQTVFCLDDGSKYMFSAGSGYEALQKMLYALNLAAEDKSAKITLCNGRTWSLIHMGKTYGCLA